MLQKADKLFWSRLLQFLSSSVASYFQNEVENSVQVFPSLLVTITYN